MTTHSRPSVLFALFLCLLGGMAMAPLSAQSDQPKDRSVYFGLMGGYGHSETQGGMADLKAEFLLPLSRSLSLGWVRISEQFDQMHGMGNAGMMGGMMGGMMDGQGGISMGLDHSFRSTPLTLTAYLRRPLGHSVGIILLEESATTGAATRMLAFRERRPSARTSGLEPTSGSHATCLLWARRATVLSGSVVSRWTPIPGLNSMIKATPWRVSGISTRPATDTTSAWTTGIWTNS